jgi:hypothetical protein
MKIAYAVLIYAALAAPAFAQQTMPEVDLTPQEVQEIQNILTSGQVTVRDGNGQTATFVNSVPLINIIARAAQETKARKDAEAAKAAVKPADAPKDAPK